VVERIARRKPVLVLTGARQVGKSTMLKEVYRHLNYVALNRPLVRQSAIDNPSLFFEEHRPPVIVDEIQKAAALFDYIKDIVDEDRAKGQFYLTGSQSMKLMKGVSESLAGRAGVIKLLGLSMRELDGIACRAPFVPTQEHRQAMRAAGAGFDYRRTAERIHKGFFPELYENPSDLRDWADYYSSYFQTYIEKDIKDVLQIQDESAFIKFVKAVASLTGEMLNLNTISGICGKDAKTVKAWLSVLESSGLVYLLEPYYNNFSKRLVKTPKLYFLDTGLACWLLGWNTPEQLVNGAMWGHMFESFVFAEVLKSYYNDGIIKPPLYYYRDKDKNEIDLLIEDGEMLYPVEIKTASDPAKAMVKAFRCVAEIPGKRLGPGAVVCLAKEALPLTEECWIWPVGMV
jgi:predicted AAA+ superfamily ATPase